MTANQHPSDPLEKPSRRALIVSGDDRFAAALARYVASEGWQTHVATNERDAAAACRQDPPEVMLVELEGHDIDGFELIAPEHREVVYRKVDEILAALARYDSDQAVATGASFPPRRLMIGTSKGLE